MVELKNCCTIAILTHNLHPTQHVADITGRRLGRRQVRTLVEFGESEQVKKIPGKCTKGHIIGQFG